MDDQKSSAEHGASPQTNIVKKKYEKPQIVYSAPLEAMAAICPEQQQGKWSGGCSFLFS